LSGSHATCHNKTIKTVFEYILNLEIFNNYINVPHHCLLSLQLQDFGIKLQLYIMLPIPVNMMLRNTVRSPPPQARSTILRGSLTPRSSLDLEVAELESMLSVAPVRRASVHMPPSIERDLADLEKMLPPMRRNSVQFGDILPKQDFEFTLPSKSSLSRRSSGQFRKMHSLPDADSIRGNSELDEIFSVIKP
jgi:hypothetical protein